MEAYCVKCREKREIRSATATFTKRAQPATRGVCAVCGTGLFCMGRTAAHAGLTPPAPEPPAARKKARGAKRTGKLVIVESPAKARTIGRFLGKGYTLKASMGHVRDLLKSRLSVDVENGFAPEYRVPNDKRKLLKALRKDVARAEIVYLATDLDREGEAIAWHMMESAEIEPERLRRVTFHEITRVAIERAFAEPRAINMQLVNAQQARRILDRLVGYSLSPLLWRKVAGRLSAGRVQSVAVRLIVEREREIESHTPQEYWRIKAELKRAGGAEREPHFVAGLRQVDGKRVGRDKEYRLGSEADVQPLLRELEHALWRVQAVTRGERRRKPSAPYRTSTLQQEASRRLGFTARRIMVLAQQLYEGMALDGKQAGGLITYMRTDSVNVSAQAQKQARNFVRDQYGESYLPAKPPTYKGAKGAQEAHEAIRPTKVGRTPAVLKDSLSRDQYRLYQLIWQRFVGSQMAAAIYDTLRVDVLARGATRPYDFRATGVTIRFPGFLRVYEPTPADDGKGEDESGEIPTLQENEALLLQKLLPEQRFTKPPPRYSEASLVKALEEHGIGRPSTYAPTLSTIVNRGYVTRESRRLFPTEIGVTVNDLLVEYFSDVLDVGFTARMENALDLIATGDAEWVPVLDGFWRPFAMDLERAAKDMPEIEKTPELVGRDCPQCGQELLVRLGRFGKFIGCSGFPDCKHTEPLLERIGVACPDCKSDLLQRRTKKGRTFFGCSAYPQCEWTSWTRPLAAACPGCGGLLLGKGKEEAVCTACAEIWDSDELSAPERRGAGTEVATPY